MGGALSRAFRTIGQETDFLDYSSLLAEFLSVRTANDPDGQFQFNLKLRTILLEKVIAFKPQWIVGLAQSPLSGRELLARLRSAGIRTCYWFVEDYRLFTYWKTLAPHVDIFFTIQREPFWRELEQSGCSRYAYLPCAFDHMADAPRPTGEPPIPASFVGAPYPNRVHYFHGLHPGTFQIFGEGWDRHDNPCVIAGGRRIAEREAWTIYRRTLVNVNLHSSPDRNGFGTGDFVNPRTFELAGLGAFQLADMRKLLTLHFDPATEVPALTNWEDLEEAIGYFLAHEDERKAFSEKARERVLREHTYVHRAKTILEAIGGLAEGGLTG